MCLIVDANVASLVFVTPDRDFKPVHDALKAKRAVAIYGGKLTEEYLKIGLREILKRLDQMGSVRLLGKEQLTALNQKAFEISQLDHCKSNDCHILALAVVAKVRLLCSKDINLTTDFTNSKIISRPKGKVYKSIKHKHLIDKCCSSQGKKRNA